MQQKKEGFINEKYFMVPNSFMSSTDSGNLIGNCYITNIGYFPLALHHFRERNEGSEDYIVLICINGTGTVQISNGTRQTLRQGQVIILPPKISHIYHASETSPWSIYWIHVNGKSLGELKEMGYIGKIKNLSINNLQTIEMLFYECFAVIKQKYSYIDYYYACQIASHILGIICSTATDYSTTEKGENAVNLAITYMKQNIHRNICIEELSHLTNYSPPYINKLFNQIKQTSPIHYFIQMKIQSASKELYFTKVPISEIAQRYGFDDPLYFSRIFKKTFGVSPKDYRRQDMG